MFHELLLLSPPASVNKENICHNKQCKVATFSVDLRGHFERGGSSFQRKTVRMTNLAYILKSIIEMGENTVRSTPQQTLG
jgi:hypothetical protein